MEDTSRPWVWLPVEGARHAIPRTLIKKGLHNGWKVKTMCGQEPVWDHPDGEAFAWPTCINCWSQTTVTIDY